LGFQTLGADDSIAAFMSKLLIYIGGILPIWYISNITISVDIYRCADALAELYLWTILGW